MKSILLFGMTFALSFLISIFAVGEGESIRTALHEDAVGESEAVVESEQISITVATQRYRGEWRLLNEELYVDFAAFCETVMGSGVSSEEGETGVFVSRGENFMAQAVQGKEYLSVNGVYHWCPGGNVRADGKLFVPFTTLAEALGTAVTEEAPGVFSAIPGGDLPRGEDYYNEDDVFWLSRIIQAESGGEFFKGKIAVGNVVLNRVRSEEFPDTIYEVIFDIRFGVQFSPVASGSVYRMPGEESVIAAKLCLGGAEIDREMIYFYNPRKSDSTWMVENCTFVASIGNHDFFS